VDSGAKPLILRVMADHYAEYAGFRFQIVALVLTGIFFVFFTYMLRPFVPAEGVFWQWLWAGFTSLSLTGTFFFAVHMFWVTFIENRQALANEE